MKKGYCVLENITRNILIVLSSEIHTKNLKHLRNSKIYFCIFYFVQDIGYTLIHATAHAIRQSYVKCF